MHHITHKLMLTASLATGALILGPAAAAPVELTTSAGTGDLQLGTNNGAYSGTGHDGPANGQWGHLGTAVTIPNPGQYAVDFEFVSAEAGWTNELRLNLPGLNSNALIFRGGNTGGSVDTSPLATGGQTDFEFGVGAGGLKLPFRFEVAQGAGAGTVVRNGLQGDFSTSNSPLRAANFFVGFDGATQSDNPTTGSAFTLAFDDGGGTGDDDNHDDLVVDVTVTKVPAPGVLGLMTAGIAGVFAAGRRRRA